MKRIAFILSAFYFVSCQQPVPTAESAKDSALAVTPIDTVLALVGDTVTIGGQLYNMTVITEEEYMGVPEWSPVDTSESAKILPDSARVHRVGDSLVLTLGNGQQKVMVNNNNDNDEYTQYSYEAYLPALQHWVVFNAGYEWHSFELIDSRTGEMTRTIGFPELSPDKKYFICSNTDLMAAFTLNGFQLFQVTPSLKPVLLQEQELENWGASTIKWKDGKTLLALQHYLDKESNEHQRFIRLTPRP